jgi:hypothetical protein
MPLSDHSNAPGRLALILSKALMLARDSEITDESIVRQLEA